MWKDKAVVVLVVTGALRAETPPNWETDKTVPPTDKIIFLFVS